MTITRILREQAIGATRAAALNDSGRPVALFLDLWSQREACARLGDVCAARLRSLALKQGGAFLELESGAEAFMRLSKDAALTEGAALQVRVTAEARTDKLARVVLPDAAPISALSYFERWQQALVNPADVKIEDVDIGSAYIEAAFDDALAPTAPLPGGGALRISQTPALTAIDVDTAGREDSGRAARRALLINLDAAREAARQLALRNLGGLVVLDCVGPLSRHDGASVRAAFLEAWRAICARKAETLPPSPFGLMQIKLEWGATPLAGLLLDETGAITGEALALSGLRAMEREARAQPMAQLCLHLPGPARDWFKRCGLNLQTAIDERYGARISVEQTPNTLPDVTQR